MERVNVAIVGAGVGGLGLAARLRATGETSFAVYERDEGLGGTWRSNTYPGAACDVPSHLYSFSFAPNAGWTRRYPQQDEILAYLERVADEHGVRGHLRPGTTVESARWQPGSRRWRLETSRGPVEARTVVAACGQLRVPHIPEFAGLGDYRGDLWHSARWNHDAALDGRRVAVIGSGASAIQIVPELARSAARLHVLQRTPPWIIARHDRAYSGVERALYARAGLARRLHRAAIWSRNESLWPALQPGSVASKALTAYATRQLRSQVADPALRAKLLPTYPVGCKRVLISDDYYPALQRPGVDLVTDAIDRFVPEGIRMRGGRVLEVDAVVLATGFDSGAFMAPMQVEGPERTLDEAWARGPRAHHGITVAGFPNLFLLYGPNTNLGHNSIIFMIEGQINYILQCLAAMRRHGVDAIDVKAEAMERSNDELQEALRDSVWTGCSNWYLSSDGTVTNNWRGSTITYRWVTRRPRLSEFAVV